jgi:hypothetical protein
VIFLNCSSRSGEALQHKTPKHGLPDDNFKD